MNVKNGIPVEWRKIGTKISLEKGIDMIHTPTPKILKVCMKLNGTSWLLSIDLINTQNSIPAHSNGLLGSWHNHHP